MLQFEGDRDEEYNKDENDKDGEWMQINKHND